MIRKEQLMKSVDHSSALRTDDENYRCVVLKVFDLMLDLDMCSNDVTSGLFSDKPDHAVIYAKQDIIVSGIEELELICQEKGLVLDTYVKDKEHAKKGDKLCEIKGDKLLSYERSILNLLMRMCGISTMTQKLSKIMPVAATRKTLYGALDKKAVVNGGGLTHRLHLKDAILIKENHIADCSIESALNLAWVRRKEVRFIEIEVQDKESALTAASKFKELRCSSDYPCVIMLDNFMPAEVNQTIDSLKDKGLYDSVLIEVSGNIDESNIRQYKEADYASAGFLTHSAKAADLSMLR